VRRDPSSRLGHGPRLRASVDLYFGMDGRRVERGAHRGGMGGQPVCRGAAPMNRERAGVPLDVDTVRKWLRQAADLLPPK
jgi:hypothetical protein